MQTATGLLAYLLSFRPYVLLPVIILLLALVFRIKLAVAMRSALAIGIGFVGIFMVFDYFVALINPVVQALIARAGLSFNVLDVGWPPLSIITWSSHLAPLLVGVLLGVNVVMLLLKLTKTIDIDIWNYWHVILLAVMVYHATDSYTSAIVSAVLSFVVVLKLSEWSAPAVRRFSGLQGIAIPHLSAITYLPIAVVGNLLVDKIPYVSKLELDPESMRRKLGLLGEPMVIGFLLGIALGVGGGYDVKKIGELAFGFAAVIYILPLVCNILGSALIPISEGMKDFIAKHLPRMGETYIGLDVAVLFGVPSVVVTSIILVPVALVLAFLLPGISFIPLGDLTNFVVPVAIISLASRGNVLRSLIIGVPVIVANLYFATHLAGLFAKMARAVNYRISGYDGLFTSFLDGGNPWRGFVVRLAEWSLWVWLALPLVLGMIFVTYRVLRSDRDAGVA